MKPDFDWPVELRRRNGAPTNLLGIEVFFDFDWNQTMGHPQIQFPHGQCLARRVQDECPEGLTPALLLTDHDEIEEGPIERDGYFAVVVNLRHYLDRANSDASAAYFGDSIGTGLTRIRQFEAISGLSPDEVEALVDAKQSRAAIERWVSGNASRLQELRDVVEADTPASEVAPISEVVEALRRLDGLGAEQVEEFKALFSEPDRQALVDFINESGLLGDRLQRSIEFGRRAKAVAELESMLSEDLTEAPWQQWFEDNDWVLGTEFVKVLEERPIDVEHIADFLVEAYDGFLDLVEIKRPEGSLRFWAEARDHGNYIPHSGLIKAVTQASRYVLEVEREANSVKFLERLGGVKAIKPRCVLIYGRSADWNDGQREAYRVLNASYHNLSIMTFDHVLARAKRILDLTEPGETS
jgi:Shedu protein SduA, C-terminal